MVRAENVALKEWSVIEHARAGMRLSVRVRTSRIYEKRGGFTVENREFWNSLPDGTPELARALA